MKRTSKQSFSLDDYIKAVKKGNREAEQLLLGPGFHSVHKVHLSKMNYKRKQKHKDTYSEQ